MISLTTSLLGMMLMVMNYTQTYTMILSCYDLAAGIQLLTSSLLSALNNHLSSRSHNDKPTITHQLLFSLAFIGFMRLGW